MPLLTAAAKLEIRDRSRRPEFAAAVERLRRDVRDLEALGLRAPQVRAGYYHDYFCPDHAVELEFDAGNPERHICPVDGREHGGDRTRAAWRWFVNNRLSTLAFKAGLRAATGESAYAATSRGILLDYAGRYGSYVPDHSYAFSGKVCYHGLDEAVWLVHLAWAYALTLEGEADGEAERVRRYLLEPAAEWVAGRRRRRIHNIECWLNAAVATAGAACDRTDLVEEALEGPFGFRTQLERGVLADGMWYENTLSYHFYVLAALLWTALACDSARPELARPQILARMLAAPLKAAAGDGSLPSLNDCWYPLDLAFRCGHGIAEPPGFYEAGWAWFGRQEFGEALLGAYAKRPRDVPECFLYGRPDLPAAGGFRPRPSVLMFDSGTAVLREGTTQLLLKYGRHGGAHGHFDKLAIGVHAAGVDLSPDLGTPGYGVALNRRWFRHTVSHNTVMVDGLAQPAGAGQLVEFALEPDLQIVCAEVEWKAAGAYRGVRMRRALALRPGYWLDVFVAEADEERRFDWIYRNKGKLVVPPAAAEVGPEGPKLHEDLKAVRSADGANYLEWNAGGAALALFLPAADASEERLVAEGPWNPAAEYAPLVIRRIRGRRATFVGVFSAWRGTPPLAGVEYVNGPGAVCGITVGAAGRKERWTIEWRHGAKPAWECKLAVEGDE